MKCHWLDASGFNQFEWDVYQFVMKLGAKVLKERLTPEDLKEAFHCTLCTQRAIANLSKHA
jgi:hypothetical protein